MFLGQRQRHRRRFRRVAPKQAFGIFGKTKRFGQDDPVGGIDTTAGKYVNVRQKACPLAPPSHEDFRCVGSLTQQDHTCRIKGSDRRASLIARQRHPAHGGGCVRT